MILNVPEIFRGHLPKTKSELAVCIFFIITNVQKVPRHFLQINGFLQFALIIYGGVWKG